MGWAVPFTKAAETGPEWGAIGTRSMGCDLRVSVQALIPNPSFLYPLTPNHLYLNSCFNRKHKKMNLHLAPGTFINTILFNSNISI